MIKLLPLLIALFAFPAFAQTDLPIIGTLADIKGMSKAYVSAAPLDRGKIIKVLTKSSAFTFVSDPKEAELFIEYKTLSTRQAGALTLSDGQMDVYVMREGKKIIAWSEGKSGPSFGAWIAGKLSGRFLEELGRAK